MTTVNRGGRATPLLDRTSHSSSVTLSFLSLRSFDRTWLSSPPPTELVGPRFSVRKDTGEWGWEAQGTS